MTIFIENHIQFILNVSTYLDVYEKESTNVEKEKKQKKYLMDNA